MNILEISASPPFSLEPDGGGIIEIPGSISRDIEIKGQVIGIEDIVIKGEL